jgi:hypothetical protein
LGFLGLVGLSVFYLVAPYTSFHQFCVFVSFFQDGVQARKIGGVETL